MAAALDAGATRDATGAVVATSADVARSARESSGAHTRSVILCSAMAAACAGIRILRQKALLCGRTRRVT